MAYPLQSAGLHYLTSDAAGGARASLAMTIAKEVSENIKMSSCRTETVPNRKSLFLKEKGSLTAHPPRQGLPQGNLTELLEQTAFNSNPKIFPETGVLISD